MAQSKVVLVLVDGLGDVSVPAFAERTPLETAHTPIMDAIAAGGLNGLMDPVEPGLACGSDTSHMSLFGYDPRLYYRGRGAFESMGAGIPMEPGDIAFKCNFATLDTATGIVTSRRADRNFVHVGPTLCAALDGLSLPGYSGYAVRVRYATEHRCGVAVSGPGLSDAVSGTDPLKDRLPLLTSQPEDATAEAAFTAGLVNALSTAIRSILEDHPINKERREQGLAAANVVLLRGCGSRIRVASFQELHGMRGVVVAPTKIIAGLAMSFGMDHVDAPGTTGAYNSDFSSKATTICQAIIGSGPHGTADGALPDGPARPATDNPQQQEDLQQQQLQPPPSAAASGSGYDFGFVHVKAVDDAGHDRKPQLKVLFQQVVDRMIGQIVRRLWEHQQASHGAVQYCLVVTGDHSTPVVFGDHSHEPVPFSIAHLAHVVESLGADYVQSIPLGPIPLPDPTKDVPYADMCQQGALCDARRKAAWAGRPWLPFMPAEVFGPWKDPWPQAVRGDAVRSFDELSAARGALGRFPGSEVMTLIKHFTGRPVASGPGMTQAGTGGPAA